MSTLFSFLLQTKQMSCPQSTCPWSSPRSSGICCRGGGCLRSGRWILSIEPSRRAAASDASSTVESGNSSTACLNKPDDFPIPAPAFFFVLRAGLARPSTTFVCSASRGAAGTCTSSTCTGSAAGAGTSGGAAAASAAASASAAALAALAAAASSAVMKGLLFASVVALVWSYSLNWPVIGSLWYHNCVEGWKYNLVLASK
mmetsp:Transcript_34141/g.56532  ORF Transcript_34141/g.56532 Transcript_34141/m.56532 type:complete len:201 (-) Transcript_34141:201-803(-)